MLRKSFQIPLIRLESLRSIAFSRILLNDDVLAKKIDYYQQESDALMKESNEYKESVMSKTALWKEMHDKFYGPERDMANFPAPRIPDYHPNVRMGFFPETFFQDVQKISGVTGPYLAVIGFNVLCLSKEFPLPADNFGLYYVWSIVAAMWVYSGMFGKGLKSSWYDHIGRMLYAKGTREKERYKLEADFLLKQSQQKTLEAEKALAVFAACKENVGLQLEQKYRERMVELQKTVKNKLDYHAMKDAAIKKYRTENMVSYIKDSFISSYGAAEEKKTMAQCLADLKVLSQKQKVATA